MLLAACMIRGECFLVMNYDYRIRHLINLFGGSKIFRGSTKGQALGKPV